MKTISACTLDCPDCCSLIIDSEKRAVRGNPDHPFTRGFCCAKGKRTLERLDSDERIVEPLIKENGRFRIADWNEALNLVAGRIQALQATPEAMLHIHGYGSRGVLAKASTRFFEALGASTHHGALCDDTGIEACLRDFGALDMNDPNQILEAGRIVNWGRDLSRSSVHVQELVGRARKAGTPVLSISPGGDGNRDLSDEIVMIRPGTDRFLAAAVIRRLLEMGRIRESVLRRTYAPDAFLDLIRSCDENALLSACEVRHADLDMLCEWYADEAPIATLLGWGTQRHVFGGENFRFINALIMLSGNVGRPGAGGYFNISSTRNFGRWNALRDGREVRPEDVPERRSFLLPDLVRELNRADPPVSFIWVDAHNVINQIPDAVGAAMAFADPFVVVVDGFMTDTALCADVILPPAFAPEREDVLGSCLHDYVNLSAKAVEPRGACRTDFDMLTDLGARLSPAISFPAPDDCLRTALADSGLSLDELRRNGFVRGPHGEIAFPNLQFGHADGLYRFPEKLDPEPERDPEYPLQLLSLVRGSAQHSQMAEKDQRGIPKVWVARSNPAWAAMDPARDTYLVTPMGSMQVALETVEGLHPRVVIMRRGGWLKFGHNPNAVIEPRLTDMGDGAAYYSQCCRLENPE